MKASNRLGMGLSYRPARLHRLAESIPGLLRSLKIPSLAGGYDNPITIQFLAPTDCTMSFLLCTILTQNNLIVTV
jgi:hypothetical protein